MIEPLRHKEERGRIERLIGEKIPESVDVAIKNFDDSEWLGPRDHVSPKRTQIETILIPPPKGSKAKPHICVSLEGVRIFEANARMECYKVLAKHIGERPFCTTYQRFDSMYENEQYYWKLIIVYELNQ